MAEIQKKRVDWLGLLLPCCPRVCGGGPSARKRRAFKSLRRARHDCAKLQKETLQVALEEDGLPLQHLRAAEHHLAALERWLAGHGPHSFDDLKLLLDELGSTGATYEEEAAAFEEHFLASGDEVLVKALPCLARSGSLNIPGKLYVSSWRLCVYSAVLGAVATFACPWQDISRVALAAQHSGKTHPIKISLKKPTGFAGQEISELCVCLFDLEGLGHFDKCVNFFTGTGLCDLLQAISVGSMSTMTSTPSGFRARSAKSSFSRQNSLTPKTFQAELEHESTLWELERRVTVWHQSWLTPFLPHDGSKKKRWMVLTDRGYVPHPSLPEASKAAPSEWAAPPIASVNFLGQDRTCSWQTVVDASSDEQGWQYAVDFYLQPSQWTPYCCGFSHVRRRKWTPTFSPHGTIEGGVSSRRLGRTSRSKSTLIQSKGLSTAQTTVLEQDIGEKSLEDLGAALEADDWLDASHPMATYFRALGSEDLEVHEWTTLQGVKGKTRSVELRVPLPPTPMCPSETRCQQTWHVSSSPTKVILESVTMSLDVPYGTSFNVVVCDTFSYKEGTQCVRMVRSCAVDWVSSIWLTSLVEQAVPQQTMAAGEHLASAVRQWAEGANFALELPSVVRGAART